MYPYDDVLMRYPNSNPAWLDAREDLGSRLVVRAIRLNVGILGHIEGAYQVNRVSK